MGRTVELIGLSEGLPDDTGSIRHTELENFDALTLKVFTGLGPLPANSYLAQAVLGALFALTDAITVAGLFKLGIVNEEVLRIIGKYKLRGVPSVLIAPKILDVAIEKINFAVVMAQRAGIMPPS